MIFTPLFILAAGLLSLLNFLPTGTLPSQVSTSFATVVSYMYVVNGIFPIDTLIQLAVLGIALEGTILAWHFVLFIINYVRGR